MSIYCRRESLTNKEIKPGETLSGFEFTSKESPGLVKFYAYGKPDGLQTVIADTPGEGEDESEFIFPGFFYDGFESDVTLVTLGPSHQIKSM